MKRALAAAAVLLACVPGNGPLMRPGSDCLSCHDGSRAPRWTVAGTWQRQGDQIAIQDSNGKKFTLSANQAANFYTAEPLAFPLQISVNGAPMPGGLSADQGGSCNRCHFNGGAPPGPLMLPGQDCLTCHDGSAAKKFTAAGTWLPQGSTVSITDASGATVTLTANQVGTFYTDAALRLPLSITVGAQRMEPLADYGGCNRCHGTGAGGDR